MPTIVGVKIRSSARPLYYEVSEPAPEHGDAVIVIKDLKVKGSSRRPGGRRGDARARVRRGRPGEGGPRRGGLAAAPSPERLAVHLDHRLPRAQGEPQGHQGLG